MDKRKKRSLLTTLIGFVLLLSLPMAALAGSTDACTGECTHEAAIGSMHYDTLGEAVTAAGSNSSTIRLLDNIQLEGTGITVAAGQKITLDLNGYTIAGISNAAASTALIDNKGTLVIDDTSAAGTGKITSSATNPDTEWAAGYPAYSNNTINNTGHLTIEGGRIENATGAGYCIPIDNLGGTLIVNGGHIVHLDGQDAIRMFANSTTTLNKVEINGGTIEGGCSAIWVHIPGASAASEKMAELTVNDGTLSGKEGEPAISVYSFGDSLAKVNVSIAGGDFESKAIAYGFANGKENDSKPTIAVSGGTFVEDSVEEYLVEGYTLKHNGNGTYGLTVDPEQDVFEAAVNDVGYTTLQKAIEAAKNGGTVTVLRDITLSASIEIAEGMDVTIEGSGKTITGAEGADVFYVKGGKLTLGEGLNLHAPTDCCVYIHGGEVVTAANMTKAGTNYSVIQGNGNYSGNVTITGGTITNQIVDGCAIYWPQDGKLTIEDGTITGGTAVRLNSGSLEISGGKLIANGTKKAYVTADGSSSFDDTGDALMIDNVGGATGYEEISQVVITGGTFTSKNAAAVGSYTAGNAGVEAKTGFITGGTYSDNSALAYLATGYTLESYTDSTGKIVYGVEPTYTVSFTLPEGATVVVKNAAGQTIAANAAGKYELTDGNYTFTVSKENYVDKSASFTVNGANQEIVITLDALEIVTHTVTYKADGEVVAQMQVAHGGDATAPAVPAKAGYTGAWNHDGKGIVADTEIVAVYTKNATGGEGGTPVTGEESNSGLWLGILLASAAALAALAVVKAKQRRTER